MLHTGATGHGFAAVSYHVTATAQREALSYWTPARMTAAAGDAGVITPQLAPVAPAGIPTAVRFGGVPTTGALFYTTGAREHFCTASVVDSATGNLVLTAAHCVYSAAHGYARNIEYVPGYDNGHEPYGAWAVTTITVASGWRTSQDTNLDFAFLTVAAASGNTPVQSRTKGLALRALVPQTEQGVEVIGYNDTGSGPVRCTVNSVPFRAGQREFYCHGYQDGTSGGPWILHYDKADGTGAVIGVIGGYEAGGDYAWVSYSAYFGSDIERLFKRAEAVSATSPAAPDITRITRITRAPRLQSSFTPYVSPGGSARSSSRTPSGSLK